MPYNIRKDGPTVKVCQNRKGVFATLEAVEQELKIMAQFSKIEEVILITEAGEKRPLQLDKQLLETALKEKTITDKPEVLKEKTITDKPEVMKRWYPRQSETDQPLPTNSSSASPEAIHKFLLEGLVFLVVLAWFHFGSITPCGIFKHELMSQHAARAAHAYSDYDKGYVFGRVSRDALDVESLSPRECVNGLWAIWIGKQDLTR
jgi:hypothetical protein